MTAETSTISVTCSCGKRLKAPAASVGKRAKCPSCGAVLVLAADAQESVAVAPSLVAAPPPLPQNPAPVLSYRTPPMANDSSGPMWREGKLAVSYRDTPFPMHCVKCNAPLQPGEAKRTTMYWQHPAYYATLALGLLIGAIILLCVRQKTEVTSGLCKVHRAQRRMRILYGWLIALAGLGCEVLSVFFMSPGPWKNYGLTPICAILGIVLIVGSLIWALVAVPAVSVRRIKERTVWFGGCGEEFLAGLEG